MAPSSSRSAAAASAIAMAMAALAPAPSAAAAAAAAAAADGAKAAAVGVRVPVPEGKGCYAIGDRSDCCFYSDGRSNSEYAGQACVPAEKGKFFSVPGYPQAKPVCQPACWASGSCGGSEDQTEVIGTCAALREEAISSEGRTKLPGGLGCWTVLDRASCCEWSDGRSEEVWANQECVPARDSLTFKASGSGYGAICQPRCWAEGTCSGLGDQTERMGFCEAPMLPEEATMNQTGARVQAGGDLRFYVVGSSNAAWQTWPDQMHAMLRSLGYDMRLPSTDIPGERDAPFGRKVPKCDDASLYEGLSTPRLGLQGWSTWGFSYENEDDCDENGFRNIAGWNVSCMNGWACTEKWRGAVPFVPVSTIAKGVRDADVVILANYVNDGRNAMYCPHDCYGAGDVPDVLQSTDITGENLKRTIRAIHAENPDTVVLVLARYADASRIVYVNEKTLERNHALNMAVKEKVETEPHTYFVDYDFPVDINVFQTLNGGHANCRGDKIMANAVIDAMFKHDVIGKGLDLGPERCLGRADCGSLELPCCQRSALCYVDDLGECSPYSPGEQ